MKFFFYAISSLTRRSFYQDILAGKMRMGFKYVFELEVLATLFIVFIISLNISGVLPIIEGVAKDILPPGAEIIVKDNKLRANVNPIVIPMPQGINGDAGEYKNLLVLDTTTVLTIADLNRKEAFVLVNSEGFVTRKENGSVQINKFTQYPGLDLTLDQQWFMNQAVWLKSNAKYVPFILFIPILIGFYLLSLFWALIYGLIAFLLLKIYKQKTPFKLAYSVGLYSRTFGLVLSILVFVAPVLNVALVAIPLNIFFVFYMIRPEHVAVPAPEK